MSASSSSASFSASSPSYRYKKTKKKASVSASVSAVVMLMYSSQNSSSSSAFHVHHPTGFFVPRRQHHHQDHQDHQQQQQRRSFFVTPAGPPPPPLAARRTSARQRLLRVSMHDRADQQRSGRSGSSSSRRGGGGGGEESSVDFYAVLGVLPHSSSDEIKRAYRIMAKKYHPDSNKDVDATDQFQQINRAYEVLKNPVLKSKYDMFGEHGIGTSAASDEAKSSSSSTRGGGGVYSGASSTRRGSRGGFGGGFDGFDHHDGFYGGNSYNSNNNYYEYDYNFHSNPADIPFGGNNGGGGYYSDPGYGNVGVGGSGNSIFDRPGRGGGSGSGGTGTGRGRHPRQHAGRVGEDLQLDMEVDFERAVFGGRETVWIDHFETCTFCQGSGEKAGMSEINCCQTCGGSGFLVELTKTSFGSLQTQRTCHGCRGSGKLLGIPEEDCESCYGRGMVERAKKVDITIPAGVEGHTRLRIRGEGNAGPKGGPSGDLIIFLHVKPHPIFRRDGSDIHANVTIDYIDAILGRTSMDTPVVGGTQVSMEVPQGTQHEAQIKVPGHGARSLVGQPGARGNHFVHVQLEIPFEITEEEEEILLQLKVLHDKREAKRHLLEIDNTDAAADDDDKVEDEEEEEEEIEEDDVLLSERDSVEIEIDDGVDIHIEDDEPVEEIVGDEELKEIANSFSAHFSSVAAEAPKPPSSSSSSSSSSSPDANTFTPMDPTTIRIDKFEKKYVTEDIQAPSKAEIKVEAVLTEPLPKVESSVTKDPLPKADPLPKSVSTSTANNNIKEVQSKPTILVEDDDEDDDGLPPFFAREMNPVNELDKLRELLNAPIASTKKTTEAKRKAQELEEMTNNELDKLRQLLYAPIESTKKTTEAKRKAREVEEMTNNELDKLRELLYAPVESTQKTKDAKRKARELEEMTQKELELLRQLLLEPLVEAPTKAAAAKPTNTEVRRAKELEHLAELVQPSDDDVIPTVISQRPKQTRRPNPWVFETKKESVQAQQTQENKKEDPQKAKPESSSTRVELKTSLSAPDKIEDTDRKSKATQAKAEDTISEPLDTAKASLPVDEQTQKAKVKAKPKSSSTKAERETSLKSLDKATKDSNIKPESSSSNKEVAATSVKSVRKQLEVVEEDTLQQEDETAEPATELAEVSQEEKLDSKAKPESSSSAKIESVNSSSPLDELEAVDEGKGGTEDDVSNPRNAPEASLLAESVDIPASESTVDDPAGEESLSALVDEILASDVDEDSDSVDFGVLGSSSEEVAVEAEIVVDAPDDEDARSFAWDEITPDSWRRKDPSDPPNKSDGRNIEETLFSIFKR